MRGGSPLVFGTFCQPREIISLDQIRSAYRKVRANNGGPGGDGITLKQFSWSIEKKLVHLYRRLSDGNYRPGPLRHVHIPKSDGSHRTLAIPCVVDRIAQTALLINILPALDRRMANESFAYRPGRSVSQALNMVCKLVNLDHHWIVDADIWQFFDSVPHQPLLRELAIWLDDARFLTLIGIWLKAFSKQGRGLAQGAPLSPLFANLFLHPIDRMLAANRIYAVRYADDFVLLSKSKRDAEHALRLVVNELEGCGLKLHPEKTHLIHAGQNFTFLGKSIGIGLKHVFKQGL